MAGFDLTTHMLSSGDDTTGNFPWKLPHISEHVSEATKTYVVLSLLEA
jgi:hypothetical protein